MVIVVVYRCGDTNLVSAASDGPATALTPVLDEQQADRSGLARLQPYKALVSGRGLALTLDRKSGG